MDNMEESYGCKGFVISISTRSCSWDVRRQQEHLRKKSTRIRLSPIHDTQRTTHNERRDDVDVDVDVDGEQRVRDVAVAWRYLDVSENSISRTGMNQIFWAARHNRRLRVLRISLNPVGSVFCSNGDALLTHGISVPVAIRENSVLRELDLSFLALSSEAGINLIDAVIDNHTLKRLSLRGNQLDDNVALMLPDLFRCNNVLEELDLSHNRLGFASAFAIAESLDANRSLKKLFLEYNRFGGSGSATLDAFARSIMMNYSLQVLFLDGNKLGPEWGVRLSEAMVRNNVLTQVSLRDNRLDSRSGEALLKAFAHCPYLLELAVTADEIGNKVYDEFRRVFSRKRASIRPDSLVEETVITTKQNQLLSSYGNTK